MDLVFVGKGYFQGVNFVQYAYEKIQTVELDRLWLSPALFRRYICFLINLVYEMKVTSSHPLVNKLQSMDIE